MNPIDELLFGLEITLLQTELLFINIQLWLKSKLIDLSMKIEVTKLKLKYAYRLFSMLILRAIPERLKILILGPKPSLTSKSFRAFLNNNKKEDAALKKRQEELYAHFLAGMEVEEELDTITNVRINLKEEVINTIKQMFIWRIE